MDTPYFTNVDEKSVKSDESEAPTTDALSKHVTRLPPSQALVQAPWVDRLMEFLSDASPLTIASITGATAIVLMSFFGRMGCLVSGVVIGGLAHSSIFHSQAISGDRRWRLKELQYAMTKETKNEVGVSLFSD